MNKKIIISVGILVVLAIAYWLISPLWRNVALNEDLPTATVTPVKDIIKDNMYSMDEETKSNLEKQTMEMKDKIMKENNTMPSSESLVISRANMIARAHEVQGSALLVKAGNDTYLRFENLKTVNGPDLRIYLSSDLSANDIVDLGPIRATEGSVNYTIPVGTDLGKYKNAMIWCRAFGVLFSYAQL